MANQRLTLWQLHEYLSPSSQRRYELCEKMPSQDEQDIAEYYCCHRVIERPNTNWKKACKFTAIFISVTTVVYFCLLFLFKWLGMSSLMPVFLSDFIEDNTVTANILGWLLTCFFAILVVLKRILIGIIKIYQHYAPEEIRRRCIFRPTCSEYTIMALQNYGVIMGLILSYDRLFKRCKGNIYRIDYPYKQTVVEQNKAE